MSFFKRDKNKNLRSTSSKTLSPHSAEEKSPAKFGMAGKEPIPRQPRETSPQRVGIVSGVLTTTASSEESLGSGIVERHFGPKGKLDRSDSKKGGAEMKKSSTDSPPRHDHLRAVDTLSGEGPAAEDFESLKLEIDPMAHIGHATTITGNIVAEEDLEIQGTIEGAIRLANHQLTVGKDGHAKASVEAHTVLVIGRISGDVVASELIEIKPGGIIGGDVKAPRIIMHDGGIVVGGMDMSASLPSSADVAKPERPKLKRVESLQLRNTESPCDSSMETEELK
jgi:cytoskeletal protein CcmA (bactofilin family)